MGGECGKRWLYAEFKVFSHSEKALGSRLYPAMHNMVGCFWNAALHNKTKGHIDYDFKNANNLVS